MAEDPQNTTQPESKSGESFWSTMPGLLTALAALITALGGILAILLSAGVIGPRLEPTALAPSAITQVATPLPTSQPSPAAGGMASRSEVQSGGAPLASEPALPTFQIENKLLLPIDVQIDGLAKGQVAAQRSKTFLLNAFPAVVDWEMIRQTTSEGRPIGDEMGGVFDAVVGGDVLVVDNVIVGQAYFYPVVSNQSNSDCEVIVNRDWENETVLEAVVPANASEVELGYYKLFTNSNLTLDCPESIYWWGMRPGEGEDQSFYDEVGVGTGVITFTLAP